MSVILNTKPTPWLYLDGVNVTTAYLDGIQVYSPPVAIGSTAYGGIVSGYMRINGVPYALIIAINGAGHGSSLAPCSSTTSAANASSAFDGSLNTTYLDGTIKTALSNYNSSGGTGYSDWYLPSLLELAHAYRCLKPSSAANNTSYGYNSFSLPFGLI